MALAVSLATMRTIARQRAGMENSTFITDSELDNLINASLRRLYNLLVDARGQGYYKAQTSFNTSNGQEAYGLPADFYQLVSVDAVLGTMTLTVHPYMEEERNRYLIPYAWGTGLPLYYRLMAGNIRFIPQPTGIYQITLGYIPAPTVLTSGSDSFDGIAGWEDFAIWDVVAMMLAKEESDPSFAIGQREMMRAEIQGLAPNRDAGQPERVQDTTTGRFGPWWAT